MKINIQKFAKVIFSFLCCLVLLLCSSFSAYAYVDYNDFVTNEEVDGDNDLVTCTISANDVHWAVVRSGVNYYAGDGSSFVTRQPLPAMALADIYSSWFYKDPLILSNIPNQTSISGSYHFDLDFSPASNANLDYNYSVVIHYLDSAGKHISYDTIVSERYEVPAIGVLGTSFDEKFTFVMDKPDGASFAYFETRFYFYAGHTGSVTISGSVSDLTMKMSISSLYRLMEKTGKTNALLDDIKQQLAEQGKTLDDLLSGTQEDQDKVDEFGSAMDGAIGDLEDAGDSLDSLDKPFVNVGALVPGELLSDSYLGLVRVLSTAWDLHPLSSMVTIMVGLLLVALLLFGKKG